MANRCVPAEDTTIEVSDNITEDTVWEAPNQYLLTNVIFVEPGVTLTIRSGTRILGQEGSALVVEARGQLLARGTLASPIVFTSARPDGQRAAGDWGGVALLGLAPTNKPGPTLEGLLEVDRAGFGGTDEAHNCGVLEYVRIEFAGFDIGQDNELNGLTLGGCGRGTLIDHVQVHFGKDDGVEVFGGTVNMSHVVITRAQDDSLDWDLGWNGVAQFVAIQQDAGQDADAGFEASGGEDPSASPPSNPNVWNVTLLGAGAGDTVGMTLKDGTAGTIGNVLLTGQASVGIDVQDGETGMRLTDGELEVTGAIFYQIGAGGTAYFPSVEDETDDVPDEGKDDDDGFDEHGFFMPDPALPDLTFGINPRLPPLNPANPGWVPQGVEVNNAAVEPPQGLSSTFADFDASATYVGAFAAASLPWTDGWTAYPEN